VRRMEASAASCTHCGKEGVALKRCMRCKQASYCGAECQKSGWMLHKEICKNLEDVRERVSVAYNTQEWREVLKWEGRMEELLANQPDESTMEGLDHFLVAHKALMMKDTSMAEGSKDHSEPIILLEGRRVELLGKMERFRDQGESMCQCAGLLMFLEKKEDAASMYQ